MSMSNHADASVQFSRLKVSNLRDAGVQSRRPGVSNPADICTVGDYLVFYIVNEGNKTVEIHRIFHGTQNIKQHLN